MKLHIRSRWGEERTVCGRLTADLDVVPEDALGAASIGDPDLCRRCAHLLRGELLHDRHWYRMRKYVRPEIKVERMLAYEWPA